MRLLVTGGSGFTGLHFVRLAVSNGHDVLALARSDVAARAVESAGATPVRGDLDDSLSLGSVFAVGADCLVNIASLGFGHADGIVTAAERAGLRRAVFVSTTALTTALPAPTRAVRTAAEERIRSSILDWTILRPTMIYGGAGDRNVWRLLQLLRRTGVVPVPGGGYRLQQPVHVEDVAAALLSAALSPVAIRRSYDIAGPEPLTLRDLIAEAAGAVGRRPVFVPMPLGLTVLALRRYELLTAHPRLRAEQVERLAEDKAFAIDAARRDLCYAPRSFRQGIQAEAAALGP